MLLTGCTNSQSTPPAHQASAYWLADATTAPNLTVAAAKPPPAGLPVFWHTAAGGSGTITATDWSGRDAGWIMFRGTLNWIGPQSPDGSRVVVGDEVVSSSGKVLGQFHGGMWADDNQHLCAVRATDGGRGAATLRRVSPNARVRVAPPAWLFLYAPGASVKRVVQVGGFSEYGNINVLACSVHSDRVVVQQTFIVHVTDIAVYRLSTGQLLHRYLPGIGVDDVVASHDGRFIAENGAEAYSSRVDQLPANRGVGTVRGAYVSTFSWDGTTVETFGGTSPTVTVTDWRTGRILWKKDGYFLKIADPAGHAVLLEQAHYGTAAGNDQFLIVRADGTELAGGSNWLAAGGGDIENAD